MIACALSLINAQISDRIGDHHTISGKCEIIGVGKEWLDFDELKAFLFVDCGSKGLQKRKDATNGIIKAIKDVGLTLSDIIYDTMTSVIKNVSISIYIISFYLFI